MRQGPLVGTNNSDLIILIFAIEFHLLFENFNFAKNI